MQLQSKVVQPEVHTCQEQQQGPQHVDVLDGEAKYYCHKCQYLSKTMALEQCNPLLDLRTCTNDDDFIKMIMDAARMTKITSYKGCIVKFALSYLFYLSHPFINVPPEVVPPEVVYYKCYRHRSRVNIKIYTQSENSINDIITDQEIA